MTDALELSADDLRKTPRALATAVKRSAERAAGTRTPYRTAMTAINEYASRHSKTMKPEMRAKLAAAKDELRVQFEMETPPKGKGGPGKRRSPGRRRA